MNEKVETYYHLRFKEARTDNHYGVSIRPGDFYHGTHGLQVAPHSRAQIERYCRDGCVKHEIHPNIPALTYPFPSSFDIIEVRAVTTYTQTVKGWNELAQELQIPNYIPFKE